MSDPVYITIVGEPIPQGSKVRNRYGGMREDNPRTRPWRETVAWHAQKEMMVRGHTLIDGPVEARLSFRFARPASHFGTGKNEGRLKPSAPEYHRVKPDIDKLTRAVLDALSGIVIRDDSRVVRLTASKDYGQPGASIEIHPL